MWYCFNRQDGRDERMRHERLAISTKRKASMVKILYPAFLTL